MSGKHYVVDDNKSLVEAMSKHEIEIEKDSLVTEFDNKINEIYTTLDSKYDRISYDLLHNNFVTTANSLYKNVDTAGKYPDSTFVYKNTHFCSDFTEMFYSCDNLTEVSDLDTSYGSDFTSMFQATYALTKICDLDTRNGIIFTGMFFNCQILEVPKIDTSKGTTFLNMFRSAKGITTIPKIDTSKGITFRYMFEGCSNLIEVPQLDTHNGTDLYSLFGDCPKLEVVPNLDTSNTNILERMFANDIALTEVPDLNFIACTQDESIFYGCTSLTNFRDNPYAPEGSRWQLSTTTGANFGDCPLNRRSILKVFKGLQNVTNATITISSTTNSYLYNEDKAIATNKGWTISVQS